MKPNVAALRILATTVTATAVIGFAAGSTGTTASASPTRGQELPAGFEQILPRGQIAAIDSPEWVEASRAGMPDNTWVLGVVIEGQARAFSINLLNFHEVVNDKIGETAYAAVW